MQAIPARPQLREIVAALQITRRRNLPVAAILTGLPSAPRHLIDAGTFTERMTKVPLGHLSVEATSLALVQPIAQTGANITAGALAAAAEASRRVPLLRSTVRLPLLAALRRPPHRPRQVTAAAQPSPRTQPGTSSTSLACPA